MYGFDRRQQWDTSTCYVQQEIMLSAYNYSDGYLGPHSTWCKKPTLIIEMNAIDRLSWPTDGLIIVLFHVCRQSTQGYVFDHVN